MMFMTPGWSPGNTFVVHPAASLLAHSSGIQDRKVGETTE
jgi:hypothetical protein